MKEAAGKADTAEDKDGTSIGKGSIEVENSSEFLNLQAAVTTHVEKRKEGEKKVQESKELTQAQKTAAAGMP